MVTESVKLKRDADFVPKWLLQMWQALRFFHAVLYGQGSGLGTIHLNLHRCTMHASSGQLPKQEAELTQLAFSLQTSQLGRAFVIGLGFHMLIL